MGYSNRKRTKVSMNGCWGGGGGGGGIEVGGREAARILMERKYI